MKFYRYNLRARATLDQFGDYSDYDLRLYCSEYDILKETPKGYWIGYKDVNPDFNGKRWVSKTAKKRYAYPSKKEALESYILRSKRRIEILKSKIKDTKFGVYLAENTIL